MSTASDTHLCSLYMEQLRDLNPDLPLVIEHLVQERVLTRSEVSKIHSTSSQFTRLCQLLASKGTAEKEAVTTAMRSFREGGRKAQKGIHKGHYSEDTHVLNGHDDSGIGKGGRVGGGKGGRGGSGEGGRRKGVERGRRGERGSGGKVEAGAGVKKTLSPAGQNEIAESHEGRRKGSSTHVMQMETFVIQFYHFISQLVLTTEGLVSQSAHPTPLLSVWLHVDLIGDQITTYFPHHLRRDIKSSKHDQLESLSLSSLLSAFKSFLKKFETLSRENKLLTSKANLVQRLTERNAHLEDEIWSLRKHQPQAVAAMHAPTEREQELETQLHLVRKELSSSKDHNRELVVINEQWALECQEKDAQIAVMDIQLKDMQSKHENMQDQVQQLQSDKSKLKRKVVEVKQKLQHASGTVEGKTSGEQDALYQLQQERDHAVEENIHLKAELEEKDRQIEENKDEIEELKDRAGNFKVQAQSKEPALKEFAALLSENRQLRDSGDEMKKEIETMKKKIRELEKEMLVYKTQMANAGLRSTSAETANGHLPSHSGILVQPLQNDDITGLQSGLSNGHAPPFFDPTPLAPERTLEQSSDIEPSDTLHSESQSTKEQRHLPPSLSLPLGECPPSCSSPNQPVAEVMGGFKFPLEERQCPTCKRVFMMIGEREFQSHVAGCQYAA